MSKIATVQTLPPSHPNMVLLFVPQPLFTSRLDAPNSPLGAPNPFHAPLNGTENHYFFRLHAGKKGKWRTGDCALNDELATGGLKIPC